MMSRFVKIILLLRLRQLVPFRFFFLILVIAYVFILRLHTSCKHILAMWLCRCLIFLTQNTVDIMPVTLVVQFIRATSRIKLSMQLISLQNAHIFTLYVLHFPSLCSLCLLGGCLLNLFLILAVPYVFLSYCCTSFSRWMTVGIN